MQSPLVDVRKLGQTGMEALRKGDAQSARTAFQKIIAAGQHDASIFLALAYACRNLKDQSGALDAVGKALALEPGNLRALVFKADHLDEIGESRAASAFYLAAIKSVSQPEALTPDLRDQLAHAQTMCDSYANKFEDFLRGRLIENGLADGPSSRRFRHSLDILTGRKARYFQEPRYFYFPELPHIQFFERGDFPWLDSVEAQTESIRAELLQVLNEDAAFKPYVEANPNLPPSQQNGMLDNPDWSAFYLWKNGEIVAENAARCPNTMRALANVPFPQVSGRSPSILFSLLRAGAKIPPHTGFVNTRLICHLPLIVPEGCFFRVGNEVRQWVEGKAWLFDDTIEHEAWNESSENRVILLFEIWRPELTMEEQGLVSAMFDAIDAHTGVKPAWEI